MNNSYSDHMFVAVVFIQGKPKTVQSRHKNIDMNLLFSSTGMPDWVLLVGPPFIFIAAFICAIVYYVKCKDLKRQLIKVTRERDELLG